MPEEGKLVELVGVRKAFGDNVVLDGIDLAIGRGEAIVVAGPSGSGKSTMLRCVNGLEGIDAGSISFDGQRVDTAGRGIASLRADIGMVFQQFNLFPHMTVERNVTLAPAKVRGLSAQAARDRARELLERVGNPEAMVAAYLVGTRGTARHAVALGGVVTATHTVGVFALGLVTLALSQCVLPEDLYPWLTLVSGLMVVVIGAGVLRSRVRAARRARGHGATATITGLIMITATNRSTTAMRMSTATTITCPTS